MSTCRTWLLDSREPLRWLSCQTIIPNLVDAYARAFGQELCPKRWSRERIWPESSVLSLSGWELLQELRREQPRLVVWADEWPHVGPFLAQAAPTLRELGTTLQLHVFGSLPLHVPEWVRVAPTLEGLRLRWIVASHRQAALLRHWLGLRAGSIEVLPFPVDEARFRFRPAARAGFRARLGVAASAPVALYSGRLSLQKNVLELLDGWPEIRGRVPGAELWLAGAPDDLGAPIYGERAGHGDLRAALAPGMLPEGVRVLGQLDGDALRDLYSAADLGISLSVHHDEDYGMSPAESLCSGLPEVLTDWGGYASFTSNGDDTGVTHVRVRPEPGGFLIDREAWIGAAVRRLRTPLTEAARAALGESWARRVGLEACARRVRELSGREAERFDRLRPSIAEEVRRVWPLTGEPADWAAYLALYAPYWETR
jgi:glycosyltransferase involved in cell wall biosynthesis